MDDAHDWNHSLPNTDNVKSIYIAVSATGSTNSFPICDKTVHCHAFLRPILVSTSTIMYSCMLLSSIACHYWLCLKFLKIFFRAEEHEHVFEQFQLDYIITIIIFSVMQDNCWNQYFYPAIIRDAGCHAVGILEVLTFMNQKTSSNSRRIDLAYIRLC